MSVTIPNLPGFINRCWPTENKERVAINIDPDVRQRLEELLWEPELHAIGYSEFINRACEIAETEIAYERTAQNAKAK
jgi:hypothetical protein